MHSTTTARGKTSPYYREKMAGFLDKDAFEPALEKMDVSFLPLVKKMGIRHLGILCEVDGS